MVDSFSGSDYDRVKASEPPQLKPLRSTWLNNDQVAGRSVASVVVYGGWSQLMSNSFPWSIKTSSIVHRGVCQLDKQ